MEEEEGGKPFAVSGATAGETRCAISLQGNPLVDSVAEHQPASPEAYFTYLHFASKVRS